jgi:hypothetical protein
MKTDPDILGGKWYWKGGIYWAIFMLLYFAYKFLPCGLLKVICATSESNFQHYKASFFSWILLSALEYSLLHRRVSDRRTYLYSRLATATLLPWFVFLIWFIGPAVYGRMPTIPLEIVYANIVTIMVGIAGAIFEQGLSTVSYSRELRTVILLLAFASLLLYMIFTFVKLPWADVFIEPDWR